MGNEVDLDDESIYKYLPKTTRELERQHMQLIGEAYWHVTFIIIEEEF